MLYEDFVKEFYEYPSTANLPEPAKSITLQRLSELLERIGGEKVLAPTSVYHLKNIAYDGIYSDEDSGISFYWTPIGSTIAMLVNYLGETECHVKLRESLTIDLHWSGTEEIPQWFIDTLVEYAKA